MRFKPGQSGNPAGRPKGAMNTLTKMRALLSDALPEVIAAVKREAANGDMAAAKLILERALPAYRTVTLPAPAPFTANTPDSDAADTIMRAATAGELDPDTAASWLNLIGARRRLDAEIAEEEAAWIVADARAAMLQRADNAEEG